MQNNSFFKINHKALHDYSKSLSIAGAVIGAILVISYCSHIKFYPSGLTISDTLFFLWVIVIFGLYYSLIVFVFLCASLFWISVYGWLKNHIGFLKKIKSDVYLPTVDWFTSFIGLIASLLIFTIAYNLNHSILTKVGAIIITGLLYVFVKDISRKLDTKNDELSSTEKPDFEQLRLLKNTFIFIIYLTPILFGQLGGGVINATFETIGVRQKLATISINSENYKSILESHTQNGLIPDVECSELCTLKNVTILFTNIGTNTKFEITRNNRKIQFVIPTSEIKLVTKEVN